MTRSTHPFSFGIYPGGASGTADGGAAEGPPDDPQRITAALDALQGGDRPLAVRAYEPFHDSPAARTSARSTPADPAQYLGGGRGLDLVLLFQSAGGLVEAFLPFVRQTVRRYGPLCSTIQITEEANVPHSGMDGTFPRVREALVRGVIAAKEELARSGLDHVAVGFNAAPSFDPADTFWAELGALGGAEFAAAVDYVGLDFFPDVFRPLAPDGEAGNLRSMVQSVLQTMRRTWLPAAGIPAATPIHITEHGWPTGPDRSPARQAEVIEAVVRTVHSQRSALNIRRYQLFDLRDADSANPNIFFQFGLLRDDYTPKPAFEVFRRLVAELTEAG